MDSYKIRENLISWMKVAKTKKTGKNQDEAQEEADRLSIEEGMTYISPFDNVDVWLGKENQVKVYTKEDIFKIIKKGQKKKLKAKVIYDGPIEAPIKKDQILAKLKIVYDQDLVGEYDLLALEDVKKVNIFSRLMKSLNYLIWGDV